jgi:hypothetical protein
VQQWYETFVRYSDTNGVLDASEISALRADWNSIIAKSGDLFKQMEAATGLSLKTTEEERKQGLAGEIKGITEGTASVLAGQMNAMRIDIKSVLESARIQQASLTGVQSNTQSMVNLTGALAGRLDRLVDLNIDIADTNRRCMVYLQRLEAKTPAQSLTPVAGPGLRGVGGTY